MPVYRCNARIGRASHAARQRLFARHQTALRHYKNLFRSEQCEELAAARREAFYSEPLDQLGRVHDLINKGRAYLKKRLEDPELATPIGNATSRPTRSPICRQRSAEVEHQCIGLALDLGGDWR